MRNEENILKAVCVLEKNNNRDSLEKIVQDVSSLIDDYRIRGNDADDTISDIISFLIRKSTAENQFIEENKAQIDVIRQECSVHSLCKNCKKNLPDLTEQNQKS